MMPHDAREYSRQRRLRMIADGLCPSCGKPRGEDRTKDCRECSQKRIKAQRDRRHRLSMEKHGIPGWAKCTLCQSATHNYEVCPLNADVIYAGEPKQPRERGRLTWIPLTPEDDMELWT